jgi:transposase InsO family protein
MPWEPVSTMELRAEFAALASAEGACMASLCARFGISRKTGYKWRERWRSEGPGGLADRSRRPAASPGRASAQTEAAVLAVRAAHPSWGARKIHHAMKARHAKGQALAPPAASTVHEILRRNGVALGRAGDPPATGRFEHAEPNALWQMDFKGHVAMERGRLHPLTVLDDCSRFSVVLAACADERTATVRTRLADAFRRYGLPRRIVTDNGPPWGNGPGSPWTPLGVFLIEHGVGVGHSRPYHPQTLGKDERFHRTLKAEALSGPPFVDLAAAEAALARWRDVYNLERPHEALGHAPPVSRYAPSPRIYQEAVERFDYAPGDLVRRVGDGGRFSLDGRLLRAPRAFRGRDIALRPTAVDGAHDLFFRHQRIGHLDIRAPDPQIAPVTHVPEQV